jgi:hypothetical protein
MVEAKDRFKQSDESVLEENGTKLMGIPALNLSHVTDALKTVTILLRRKRRMMLASTHGNDDW